MAGLSLTKKAFMANAAFDGVAPIDYIAETLGHNSSRISKENYHLRGSLKKEHDVGEFVDIQF